MASSLAEKKALAARALAYWREHLSEAPSVPETAAALKVGAAFLARAFKAAGYLPPGKEFNQLRFAKAREFLIARELSIGQIAGELGFADVAAFSHFFRARAGKSPGAFRRAINYLL